MRQAIVIEPQETLWSYDKSLSSMSARLIPTQSIFGMFKAASKLYEMYLLSQESKNTMCRFSEQYGLNNYFKDVLTPDHDSLKNGKAVYRFDKSLALCNIREDVRVVAGKEISDLKATLQASKNGKKIDYFLAISKDKQEQEKFKEMKAEWYSGDMELRFAPSLERMRELL